MGNLENSSEDTKSIQAKLVSFYLFTFLDEEKTRRIADRGCNFDRSI